MVNALLPRKPGSRIATQATRGGVVLLILASAVSAEETTAIPWRTGFEAAESEARSAGKLLWVQFTGPWCLFCRRMERETFTRPEVAERTRAGFVPVKVRSDEREDLTIRYQVTALPTTVILDPSGRVLARNEGYLDTGEFLTLIDSVRPRAESEIALAGFDPVHLVQGRGLVSGLPVYTASMDGREYRFVNAQDREAFLKNPDPYLPCGGGRCLVSLVEQRASVAGDPRYGVYYRGHLYLCADQQAREAFAANPERYAQADVAEQGLCPHCGGLASERKVRGVPQFSAIYRGFRYLFPDDTHRQAFRSEPEKYLR